MIGRVIFAVLLVATLAFGVWFNMQPICKRYGEVTVCR